MRELEGNGDKSTTTIAIWKSTKDKLDRNRAPGQCYNGFICQLIDLWEKTGEEKIYSEAGPAGGNQGAEVRSLPVSLIKRNSPLPCGEPMAAIGLSAGD